MTILRLVPRYVDRVSDMLARITAPKARFVGGRGLRTRVLAFKHAHKL